MSHFGAFLAVSVLALAAAPAFAQSEAAAVSVARGHVLVQQNCSVCHAVGTAGDSPNPIAPHFRDLHQRYPVNNLAEALAEGIISGHPEMPQFRFSADEVNDIIAYLESIQTRRNARTTATSAGG